MNSLECTKFSPPRFFGEDNGVKLEFKRFPSFEEGVRGGWVFRQSSRSSGLIDLVFRPTAYPLLKPPPFEEEVFV